MVIAFLIPYLLADRTGLQRDVYCGVYVAAVTGLFIGWSRDTGRSLREICARQWKLAVVLGVVAAGAMAFIATRQDASGPHPGGLTLIGSVAWRGVVYGAADGLLLFLARRAAHLDRTRTSAHGLSNRSRAEGSSIPGS